jgi:cysteine-rich repeat protein
MSKEYENMSGKRLQKSCFKMAVCVFALLYGATQFGCRYTFYSGPRVDGGTQDGTQDGTDDGAFDGAADSAFSDGRPPDGSLPDSRLPDGQQGDADESDSSGALCGNNITETGEECDDGANGDPCDGCLDDCTTHTNDCGDGFVCEDEECDDANTSGQDGCTSNCNVANGWTCSGAPSQCWRYTVTWVNIEGGDFSMGFSAGQANELPVHTVSVPTFEMTESEITVVQFADCVHAGVCVPPGIADPLCNWNVSGQQAHPVNCVTWQQAVDYCDYVGGRLPSEAEWEYAARSQGQNIPYPWGTDIADCTLAVMQSNGGEGCGTNDTWVVCSKPAGNTDQGLCDMSGNVWEWVQDWYHDDYSGAPTDGSAWVSPSGTSRVIRGGSLFSYSDMLRSAYRLMDDPNGYSEALGFRCVR